MVVALRRSSIWCLVPINAYDRLLESEYLHPRLKMSALLLQFGWSLVTSWDEVQRLLLSIECERQRTGGIYGKVPPNESGPSSPIDLITPSPKSQSLNNAWPVDLHCTRTIGRSA